MATSAGVQAQNHARKVLVERHRAEYEEIYRAEVLRLGGKLRLTKQEKIARLQAQIAKLEAN